VNLNKPLNQPQLKNWFDEKFRDGLLVKSPYDKQAHSQILELIENNGNGGIDLSSLSSSITKRLDEILAAVERSHECDPVDKDVLVEKLKIFMAEKELTIYDVAKLIKRDPKTVFQFLSKKVNPQDRTIYKIKELVDNHSTGKTEE